MKRTILTATLFAIFAPQFTPIFAQAPEPITFAETDWPWWRGPKRNGVAMQNQKPPLTWSDTKNVLWKTAVPGRGHGSPTLVGNRIYLATADETKQIQSLLCFNRITGDQIWKTDLLQGGFSKKGNKRNSHASCSVACDGKRLFANFNNSGAVYLVALNLDGKKLWQKKITDYVVHQGYGASPTVYGDVVLASADNKGGGAIAAYNRKTGKLVWRHERPETPNYASPIILNVSGRDQLLFTGCDKVASFEPNSGKKLWEAEGSTTETVTSVVTDGTSIFISGGYPRNHIAAMKADGSGKVLWNHKIRAYVPSMIVHDGYLYTYNDLGVALCTNCRTGEITWKKRLGEPVNSSLVLVGNLLFATNQEGRTFIYNANPKAFELVAQNQLGNDVFATPVICDSRIYMRVGFIGDGGRREYLYCIGPK